MRNILRALGAFLIAAAAVFGTALPSGAQEYEPTDSDEIVTTEANPDDCYVDEDGHGPDCDDPADDPVDDCVTDGVADDGYGHGPDCYDPVDDPDALCGWDNDGNRIGPDCDDETTTTTEPEDSGEEADMFPRADITEIWLDECDIVVDFVVTTPGTYHVEVWDDGELIGVDPVDTEEGQAQGRYTLTSAVKQGASGLGIGVADGADGPHLDMIDPYDGANDMIEFCAAKDLAAKKPGVAAPAVPVVAQPTYTG